MDLGALQRKALFCANFVLIIGFIVICWIGVTQLVENINPQLLRRVHVFKYLLEEKEKLNQGFLMCMDHLQLIVLLEEAN